MIYYSEAKRGRKSYFTKTTTDEHGQVITSRQVEIPLYIIEKDNTEWFLLYDDEMQLLTKPSIYLNFCLENNSIKTKRVAANALRLLYVFLSLTNYDIDHITLEQLNELIKFLQGLNSNPVNFKTETTRSNQTINNYLGIYRQYFKKQSIRCPALFDAKIVRETFDFANDASGTVERIQYTNNLRTTSPNTHTVPKFISPDEFNKLNKAAIKNDDKLAMCIMRLMYCYGLRLGEVLGLTLEDLKETHRDNQLVPTIILRNRLSDKDDQFAKNLGHISKKELYRSKEYTKLKSVIVIDYTLYELICDYINEAHVDAMERHPEQYNSSMADIVSYKDPPETNHYIFLSNRGTTLSAQSWGKRLKKYFKECEIPLDVEYRENNLSHRFRHGYAMLHSHYRTNPVNALQLQKMMRHRSISSTMIYYNPTLEEEFKIKEEFTKELFELVPSLKEGSDLFEQ